MHKLFKFADRWNRRQVYTEWRTCTADIYVYIHVHVYTIFPRNLAKARFYFKAPFGAATIWGQYLQRSTCTHVHSFNNKPSCMHIKCPCAYGNCCWPLTMRRDFEGGVYWDEFADRYDGISRCGEISRKYGIYREKSLDWVHLCGARFSSPQWQMKYLDLCKAIGSIL